MISEGMDVKTVQAALGHTEATTTMNVYTHHFQKAQAKASDAISSVLKLDSINNGQITDKMK